VPQLIGWKERVTFPEWGLRGVKAKIDTGARSSAIHVAQYQLVEEASGMMAMIDLSGHRRFRPKVSAIAVPVLGMIAVKNSGGVVEMRPVVDALIRLGTVEKTIRLTVTDRSTMLFPLLLGRTALSDDFLVDVGRKYLLNRSK